jgi:hypothetical protein
MSNYERYWNDCSFIYQTLVNQYDVPKDNIFVAMSDGTDPADDMRCQSGKFKSQPLDLDNDSIDDIQYAATKENVKEILSTLSDKLSEDDHLFFYVIDHGGRGAKSSYICLWDGEKLYDYELADLLAPLSEKYVNVNVVLGQCYSGGFVEDLKSINCVVATASDEEENSYSCSDIPYDEFVYQWTCAINGATHDQMVVNADADNNGAVTMDEAFDYAKLNDRNDNEHPKYSSIPQSIGEDLAFNRIAQATDLYIKDNEEDTGKEPNMTINEFWKSPSICVRNEDDGIFEHQNPEYSSDHQMVYIYVRIHNRGKKDYTGGKFIQIYWAQASTGLTTKAWKGREIYKDENSSSQYATGGALEAKYIDSIPAGGYRDVKLRWALPNLLEEYPEGNFHFCLLGKIMDTPYDDGYKDGVTYFNIRGSNDQAQKNVTIIRKKDVNKGFNVYVRNLFSTQKAYTLELIPQTETDSEIYSLANVEMTMSPKVYTAWENGGFQYEDLELSSSLSNSTDLRKVRLLSPKSKIKSITLQGNEFDVVTLKFDFSEYSSVSKTYSLDLIQKDEDGNVVGGETFIVESPTLTLKPVLIESKAITPNHIQLNADSSDFTSYVWKDQTGKKIGEGSSITVSPETNNLKYTVIAMNEDGEIAEDSISLATINGIKSVLLESGNIDISLKEGASSNSYMSISSIEKGTVVTRESLARGESKISVNIADWNSGIYIVTYYVDDIVVDSRKINVVK